MRKQKIELLLLAALAFSYILSWRGASARIIECAEGCKSCWGTRSNQCTGCEEGLILQSYRCRSIFEGCNEGYILSTSDMRCKRSITDVDFPCPPGTFNDLKGQTQCQACGPGVSCEVFGLATTSSYDCAPGHYCQESVTLRTPVKEYAADYTLICVEEECFNFADPVTEPIEGIVNYWLAFSSRRSVQQRVYRGDVCQPGHYCPSGTSVMKKCTEGYYCPNPNMKEQPDARWECQKGFFCTEGSGTATPGNPFYIEQRQEYRNVIPAKGNICQKGHYCPDNSSKQFACPPGFYMPYIGAVSRNRCIPCPYGKYCPESGITTVETESRNCEAGYYCEQVSLTSRQYKCGFDKKCELGIIYPVACRAEEYTPTQTSTQCLPCPDGRLCREGVIQICAGGTYCGKNSQRRCKPGEYGLIDNVGKSSKDDVCVKCERGKACFQYKPHIQIPCSEGFICYRGAQTVKPNGRDDNGLICSPGFYCTQGTIEQAECEPGTYCPNWGSYNSRSSCYAGYYCTSGSKVASQNPCPPGHYCPEKSETPRPCPEGYYQTGFGAIKVEDCIKCPEGVYCLGEGLHYAPVFIHEEDRKEGEEDICIDNEHFEESDTCPRHVQCPLGSYCPRSGQNVMKCDKGFYCPGQRSQIACEAGFYQDEVEQKECKLCGSSNLLAGLYCDGSRPYEDGLLCPKGFYCPAGTKHANQYPCPPGTFGQRVGARDVDTACSRCTAGYFCQFKAQTSVSTKLYASYHGNGQIGWSRPDPYLCPQLAYCKEGSADATTPCPNGQWTITRGSGSINSCIPCPRGHFCNFSDMWKDESFTSWRRENPSFTLADLEENFSGLSKYWGKCNSGFICLEGSTDPNPDSVRDGYECPIGHYCPEGAIIQRPCPPGYINDKTKQGVCQGCPAGTYCNQFSMTEGVECETGHFCPGTDSTYPGKATFVQLRQTPCPSGTYGAPAGSKSDEACILCENGKYCDLVGSQQPRGDCASGFICLRGNARPGPYATLYIENEQSGKCPIGTYCKGKRLQEPIQCPSRYYQSTVNAIECEKCPPGYFCIGGATEPQPCDAGYYCREGSNHPKPLGGEMGDLCPVNHFCEIGTSAPAPCRDGWRQPAIGQTQCQPCEAGFICTRGGLMTKCPAYRFCNRNTTMPYGILCENGYYGSPALKGLTDTTQCIKCPQGKFCTAAKITGDCAPGYICVEQADSHLPNNIDLASVAYPCPFGYYCIEGAIFPIKCPFATFTYSKGAKQPEECSECKIGFYCPEDEDVPIICPPGHYCPRAVHKPKPCPVGTYNPYQEQGQFLDCLPCAAGYVCSDQAISKLTYKYECPVGHYCVAGYNMQPIGCGQGTYLDKLGDMEDINLESLDEVEYLKLNETIWMGYHPVFELEEMDSHFEIGSGKYYLDGIAQDFETADSFDDCVTCPVGYICTRDTGNRYSIPCPAGYFCPAGSGHPQTCPFGCYCQGTGPGLVDIDDCPEGYFCPAGTIEPEVCDGIEKCPYHGLDCPPGTWEGIENCETCEAGHVCDGLTSQKYPISRVEENGYECPLGSFCPPGTSTETIQKCPAGRYRRTIRGKTLDDCYSCLSNSYQTLEGQDGCTLCGSGSMATADRLGCECIGAFRIWQKSTNSCVCQAGHREPVVTEPIQTLTYDLDCRPQVRPYCPDDQFVNSALQCQLKTSCEKASSCDGQKGGFYDTELQDCFCPNQKGDEPEAHCDSKCQFESLKVFITGDGYLEMQAGNQVAFFNLLEGDLDGRLNTVGMECPEERCQVMSQRLLDGTIVGSQEASKDFVDLWKEEINPEYKSPYPDVTQKRRSRMLEPYYFGDIENNEPMDIIEAEFNSTSSNSQGQRSLEDLDLNENQVINPNSFIQQSIYCLRPHESITFEVTTQHFPVYLKDSAYNRYIITSEEGQKQTSFDYGFFSLLKNKLHLAKIEQITSFMATFSNQGVYVLADHATPDVIQTIVLVTGNDATCGGQTLWPLTATNMKKFNIVPSGTRHMRELDPWCRVIPIFFIFIAFVTTTLLNLYENYENRIDEERSLDRYQQSRIGQLARYARRMKKRRQSDGINRSDMIGTYLYPIVQALKEQIEKNQQEIDDEKTKNFDGLLKEKYNSLNELLSQGKEKELNEMKARIHQMLKNIRFKDGRSIEEAKADIKNEKSLKKQADKMNKMEEEIKKKQEKDIKAVNNFLAGFADLAKNQVAAMLQKKEAKKAAEEKNKEKEDPKETIAESERGPNKEVAEESMAHRASLRRKRDAFIASLDQNLTEQQKADMIKDYDHKMANIASLLQKDLLDQDAALQARLKNRKRNKTSMEPKVKQEITDQQKVIKDIQKEMKKLVTEQKEISKKGVNTEEMKKERVEEYKARVAGLKQDQAKALNKAKEEFLSKIKDAKNPHEKDRLVEEMTKALKSVEAAQKKEKEQQEARLDNMLKARQAQRMKNKTKAIDNQLVELGTQVDKLQGNLDKEKAEIYANQGNLDGLLIDPAITKVKDRLAEEIDNLFTARSISGFLSTFGDEEKEEIDLHKVQLDLEMQKELIGAEAEIDQEVDKGIRQQELLDQKKELSQKLGKESDPTERDKLFAQLQALEADLEIQMAKDKANQEKNLDEKLKRRQQLLQIKKMQIECDQIDRLNEKELETANTKFDKKMDEMDQQLDKLLDKEVEQIMVKPGQGKEKVLIIVNEVLDDSLDRKLRQLMNKEFNDLTNYMGSLESKLQMQHMIRARKQEIKFEKEKEEAMNSGLSQSALADRMESLEAARDLELEISLQKLETDRQEQEHELRESLEERFCDEKKALIRKHAYMKRDKLKEVMQKQPQDATLQDIGKKLLETDVQNTDGELQTQARIMEQNLEKVKKRVIAFQENQAEEMALSPRAAILSPREFMEEEEKKLEEELKDRRSNIMGQKKAAQDERMKQAHLMAPDQIIELQAKFKRQLEALDNAIAAEEFNQISKMRQKMLTRKIKRERQRVMQKQAEEAAEQRARVQRMNKGLGMAFRQMISMKQGKKMTKLQSILNNEDILKVRLSSWKTQVEKERDARGGEDKTIWNDIAAKEVDQVKLEQDKIKMKLIGAIRERAIKFTLEELYKRIKRVQRMTKISDDFVYMNFDSIVPVENVDEEENPFDQVGKMTLTPQIKQELFGVQEQQAKDDNELLRFESAKPLVKGKAGELPDLLKFAMSGQVVEPATNKKKMKMRVAKIQGIEPSTTSRVAQNPSMLPSTRTPQQDNMSRTMIDEKSYTQLNSDRENALFGNQYMKVAPFDGTIDSKKVIGPDFFNPLRNSNDQAVDLDRMVQDRNRNATASIDIFRPTPQQEDDYLEQAQVTYEKTGNEEQDSHRRLIFSEKAQDLPEEEEKIGPGLIMQDLTDDLDMTGKPLMGDISGEVPFSGAVKAYKNDPSYKTSPGFTRNGSVVKSRNSSYATNANNMSGTSRKKTGRHPDDKIVQDVDDDELDERASLLGSSLGNQRLRQAMLAEPQPVLGRQGTIPPIKDRSQNSKLSNMTNNFLHSPKGSDREDNNDADGAD